MESTVLRELVNKSTVLTVLLCFLLENKIKNYSKLPRTEQLQGYLTLSIVADFLIWYNKNQTEELFSSVIEMETSEIYYFLFLTMYLNSCHSHK